jgi:hypothetical protein
MGWSHSVSYRGNFLFHSDPSFSGKRMRNLTRLLVGAYFVCSVNGEHMLCVPTTETVFMGSPRPDDPKEITAEEVNELVKDLQRQVKELQERLPRKK